MAIPLYVPDGIGPVFDANNNQGPPRRLPTNELNNQEVGNREIRQVPERLPRDRISFTAFPHQLITELYQLYQTHIGNYIRMDRDGQDGERPVQGAEAPLPGRDNSRDEIYLRHRLPLPDIVQCHAGLSLDLTFESTTILRNVSRTVHSRGRSTGGGRRRSSSSLSDPTPSLSNNMVDDEDDEQVIHEDWSLELKLLIGPWRQTGMELRAIADRFQEEYSARHPDVIRERRCIKLRVFVNLAVPAAAILGYGLAWLWNRD